MSLFVPEVKEGINPTVYLIECTTPSENKIFRETIDKYHSYVKYKDSPTRNIRWLVYESVSGNLVGAIGLSSATIAVAKRDEYIGWDNITKMKNLGKLANNSRFCLIRANFTIRNIGSMTLKNLRIVGSKRWKEKYNEPLILIETFVQPERGEELDGKMTRNGAIYLADNWINVGMTSGASIRKTPLKLWAKETGERGRLARENPEECLKQYAGYLGEHNGSGFSVTKSPKKIILIKPLVFNWKKILTSNSFDQMDVVDIKTNSTIRTSKEEMGFY